MEEPAAPRPGAASGSRWLRWWPAVFVLVAGWVVARTVGDYGVAWDESVQARYGELALDYFASGLRDRSYESFWNLRYYGALFEMVAAGAGRLDPAHAFVLRHACIAATAIAAVLGAIRFAALLEVRGATVLACLALATYPGFYGHAFQNSKDVPFAAAFAWSMVALVTLLGRARPRWRDAVACGLAFGAALAVRVGGAPLLLGFAGVAAVYWWFAYRQAPALRGQAAEAGERAHRAARSAGPARVALQLTLALVLAWAAMVATWPFAQQAPLANPLAAVSVATFFPYRMPVLFEGRYLPSDALPGSYLAELLVLTAPLALLGFALVGLAAAVAIQRARPRSRAALACWLLELWVVLPPALFAIGRPNIYDGLRHFLFVLPGVAILAGLGAAHLISLGATPAVRRVAAVAAAVLLALPVADLTRLHPYEMTYFNPLAGGVAGASRRFDTDYWATSYREAMEWIAADADGRPAVVLVAATDYSRACADAYRPPNVELRTLWEGGIDGPLPGGLPPGVDYYLATTRVGLAANFSAAPVVHAVGRDGAVFAVVRGTGGARADGRLASPAGG